MYTMELPFGFISEDFEKASAYCKHFNCKIHKAKRGSVYNLVETENSINFFWLGCNLNLKSNSSLAMSSAEKYLGK